ncbi:MAG: DUF349 domain-containing protein [Taibaiella sp.]|nr:DUF349 domain-containing protein [Taibaiella sp.]
MTPEQTSSIITWWEEQTFPGKELFKLEDNGALTLMGTANIKERLIATISPDTADMVLKTLREKFETVLGRVREAEVEWMATEDKLKLCDKAEQLKDQLSQVSAIGDFEKPVLVVQDWLHTIAALMEENVKIKTKLTEQAESLAESTEWKETTQSFKDISDKWKQAGYIDRHRNDQFYNRIEAARKTFLDRKRAQQDDNEKDLLLTLDLKIELAEQAEAMSNSEEWKATTEAYQKIIEQWKTIGRTLPKKNEELWQRIINAKSNFFDRKKAHFNMIQQEQEGNYALKLSIVERAEALRESKDWNQTAQAYAALMDEWKKTGRVAHDKSEELWKRYNEAQEQFFSARKVHTEAIRVVFDNNYQQKSALLKRAEELKNSSRWGEVTAEMNKLFEDWKKIGPVAREHNNTLWEAFMGARKHFFARKDNNRDQRKMYADTQKSARTEQAYTIVHKMEQEIAEEEEKLADFNNALENITPSKKAAELRTHLEVLISDSKAKMKRMREKMAAGQDELKHIEEEEKERRKKMEQETAPREPKDTNKAKTPKEPRQASKAEANKEIPEPQHGKEVEEVKEPTKPEETEEVKEPQESAAVEEIHEVPAVTDVKNVQEAHEEVKEPAQPEETEEMKEPQEAAAVEEIHEVPAVTDIKDVQEAHETDEVTPVEEVQEVQSIQETNDTQNVQEVKSADEVKEKNEVKETVNE